MKHLALWVLKIYQKFFTLFSYGSCRYYPTCSEYAKWQILHNGFFKACFLSILRILRCNQLFSGGIDYPVISKNRLKFSPFTAKRPLLNNIIFWFIPKDEKSFYVIKAFKNNLKREHRD
ncbi:MAG TPA: membrane protein insertion efficiency factor YidD [Sulfurospirillum sp. UBA11407]|jgi:putative membrane protein insertion efficiency factor|nr:MAG TPA: membrane protein insertion efficiency factor YidD [Sulfurospirillum sp. UBA11407]